MAKKPDKKLRNSRPTRQQRLDEFLKVRETKRTAFYHGEERS